MVLPSEKFLEQVQDQVERREDFESPPGVEVVEGLAQQHAFCDRSRPKPIPRAGEEEELTIDD